MAALADQYTVEFQSACVRTPWRTPYVAHTRLVWCKIYKNVSWLRLTSRACPGMESQTRNQAHTPFEIEKTNVNTEKSGFIHLSAKVEEEICLLKTHTTCHLRPGFGRGCHLRAEFSSTYSICKCGFGLCPPVEVHIQSVLATMRTR